MDISTQSKGRVDKYSAMSTEALKNVIGMRIENPQIFKEFMASETVDWDYAVAAGILTRADVKYIKEKNTSITTDTSGLEPYTPPENPNNPGPGGMA